MAIVLNFLIQLGLKFLTISAHAEKLTIILVVFSCGGNIHDCDLIMSVCSKLLIHYFIIP